MLRQNSQKKFPNCEESYHIQVTKKIHARKPLEKHTAI